MEIRLAAMDDLAAVTALEAVCFPPAEAAQEDSFRARLAAYPNHFWLLEDEGRLVSFVNGLVTDMYDLTDEMFDDASYHNENGAWQMIFGVVTHPDYQYRGCAEKLLHYVVEQARRQGRKGLVLTCKEHLLHFYGKVGFVDEGISGSTHGGAVWHKMRLTFWQMAGKGGSISPLPFFKRVCYT